MDELARPNIGNHGRCGYNARFHGYFIVLTQKNHAALHGLSVDRCLVTPEGLVPVRKSWTLKESRPSPSGPQGPRQMVDLCDRQFRDSHSSAQGRIPLFAHPHLPMHYFGKLCIHP